MTEQNTPPDDQHTPGGHPGSPESTARTESWACDRPAELEVSIEIGRIEVSLAEDATEVRLELSADQERGGWSRGLSGLLNRLGEATGPGGSFRFGGHEVSFGGREFSFGGRNFDLSDLAGLDLAGDAVRATGVDWAPAGHRLTVRSSDRMPLRMVALTAKVSAPAGSRVLLHTGTGPITVTGRSGHAEVRTGSGDVRLDLVDGDLRLDSGSGEACAHTVSGRTETKTGSGNLTLDVLDGPATLRAGSGNIRLGAVRGDVQAKTGSGDLTVTDAERGRLSLATGSGDLTVSVHSGVTAELDLSSGSGRARSELTVSDTAPADGPAVVCIQGSTGSGDVLVSRALSSTGAAG